MLGHRFATIRACRARVWGLAMCASLGCSAHTASPPALAEQPNVAHADSRATRVAKIVPAMPADAVDLGPVLVSDAHKRLPPQDFLLIEADRLHADGFVAEGRAVQEVYALSHEWRAKHPKASTATEIALALLFAGGYPIQSMSAPASVQQRAFYRAYRIAKVAPPPADVQSEAIPDDQRADFATAKGLGEQLMLAHALLATQTIDVTTYENIRAHLVSALDATSASRPQ